MSPAAARKRSRRSKRRRRRGGHSLSPSLFALAPLCTAVKRAEGRKDARRGPRFVNIETTDNLESALGKREHEKKVRFSFSPPLCFDCWKKKSPSDASESSRRSAREDSHSDYLRVRRAPTPRASRAGGGGKSMLFQEKSGRKEEMRNSATGPIECPPRTTTAVTFFLSPSSRALTPLPSH